MSAVPGRFAALLPALLALAFFLHGAWSAPATPVLWPDSPSYLNFEPTRTAAYPLFLAAVGRLFGDLAPLPILQLALVTGGALALAQGLRVLTGSVRVAGAALLLVFVNRDMVAYADSVLTEAPFLALVMAGFGALAAAVRRRSRGWFALACALLAVAVLVRPAGYSLLLVVPVVPLLWRGLAARAASLLAGLLPVALVLALGVVAYHERHGAWTTQSFLGNTMIGKAARFAEPEIGGRHPELVAWIAEETAPARAALERVEDWRQRFLLLVPAYDVWRWDRIWVGLPARGGIDPANGEAVDRLALEIARDVLAARPFAYAADIGLNWLALWTLPNFMTAGEVEVMRGTLARNGPWPEPDLKPRPFQTRSLPAIAGLRLFLGMAFLASVLAPLGVAWRWLRRRPVDPRWAFAATASLALHGSLLLVAATQAGLPRYAWMVWPLQVAAILSLASALLRPRSTAP